MTFDSSTLTGSIAPPPLKHRGPCGKACYGSQASAQRSVRAMQRSGKDQKYRGYLHAYVCHDCRAWHVGHTSYEED